MSPQIFWNLLSVEEGGGGQEHMSVYMYKYRENQTSLFLYCEIIKWLISHITMSFLNIWAHFSQIIFLVTNIYASLH